MAKAMTDDELRALTDAELRQSIGYWGGKLSEQRRKAEYYYLGLPKGDLSPPEIEGRSSVVSPDVRNTIESMLPQLMVKFVGGDTVVEFEPQQEGDEDKAQLCTDYLNYLFFKKNNGHKIVYTWFKDALLQKVGIVKCWWDTRTEETREEYKALDDIELAQILDDEEVEPKEHNAYPDEEDAEQRKQAIEQLTQQMQQAMQAAQQNPQAAQAVQQMQAQLQQIEQTPPKVLHDITVIRSKKGGKLTIENVPPEEFMISRKAKDIATASFVGHRVPRTVSDLKSMGYKNVDNLSSDDTAATLNAERVERLSWDDEQAYLNVDGDSRDDSQRVIWVTECYIRCDYDGDGISELRKVVRAGNEILDNEVVDIAPFASICPIPLPHKFFGLSIADLGFEAQRSKTSILRAYLDNMYLQVNGRYFAVENQVNLDDLLTSRPGGVVRVKQPGATGRLDQGMSDSAGALHTLEYMEDFLENSTGWTRYSQGTDSKSLNDTATGINIITNKADMRTDLIARNFAEGFTDLFRLMLKLVCQNQDREAITKIAGKWVSIDPREWRNQFDCTINVGLGTGNKDQQVQHLMLLGQKQAEGLQIGVTTPQNIYEADKELAKLLGFKSGDKFFTDPSQAPPQQQQQGPDPAMLKVQADREHNQASLQLETQKAQAQAQIEASRNQMEAQRETMRLQHEMELEQMKAQNAQQLEQWKIQHDADIKLQIAQIDASAKVQVAEIGANSTISAQQASAANDAVGMDEQPKLSDVMAIMQQLVAHITAPKTIERGQDGRAVSVGGRPVVRGPDGRISGLQ